MRRALDRVDGVETTIRAVMFDCDGILVDSEAITNGVLREMLADLGWELSEAESMRRFVGRALVDEADLIEEHTGFRITPEWLATFRAERNVRLARDLEPIPGAVEAVRRTAATYDGAIACVSGADRAKMELQLAKVGLLEDFAGRLVSGMEMPRSKPAPDAYLAGAALLGVAPGGCAVVEDTPTGVRAGVAAGAHAFGYTPAGSPAHTTPQALRAVGAVATFGDMVEVPVVFTRDLGPGSVDAASA